jgi:TRAP-type C4-dicarboxylate transport system substrate-binding protein
LKKLNLSIIIIMALLLLIPVIASACKPDEPATPSTPSQPNTPAEPAKPAAEPIELSLASLYPPGAAPAQSLDRWAERIKEQSNGMLTVRHYSASTLLPAPDMRTGVEAGTADLGCSFIYKPEPGFEPSMVMAQLILGLNYTTCLEIFDDIWNEFPDMWEGQWDKFKLIWITVIDPNLLFTVDTPVYTMNDIKGLQIRMPDAVAANMFKALGAAPVSMSTADWVVSLDKGTTDGAATSAGSILDHQVGEKVKYCTRYSTGPGVTFLVMNKEKYNSLSPELQKIIDDNMEWGKQDMIQSKLDAETESYEYLAANGVEVIDLSADEHAKWDETVRPVYDGIASELDEAGYPGTELVDYALERAKYYYSEK